MQLRLRQRRRPSVQNPSPRLKRLSIAKLTADYIEGSLANGGTYESKTLKLRNDQWRTIVLALRTQVEAENNA